MAKAGDDTPRASVTGKKRLRDVAPKETLQDGIIDGASPQRRTVDANGKCRSLGEKRHKSEETPKSVDGGTVTSNNHSPTLSSQAIVVGKVAEEVQSAEGDDAPEELLYSLLSAAHPSWGSAEELSDLEEVPAAVDELGTVADSSEDDAWKRGFEELRRARKLEEEKGIDVGRPSGGAASRLDGPDFAELIRQAVRGGSWTPITCPGPNPKPTAVIAAIRSLHEHEVTELVRVCANRYESHPRERSLCAVWIMQAIALHGASLVGLRQLRDVLRVLFRKLSARVGRIRRGGQVLECIGKWKLVRAMALVRTRTAQTDAPDVAVGVDIAADGDIEEDGDVEEDADDGESASGDGSGGDSE